MAVLAVFCLASVAAVTAQGKTVRVLDGDTETTLYTLRTEPKEILALAGIELLDGDQMEFSGFQNKTAELTIHRAVEVSVTYANECKTLRLANATAEDAIKKAGFTLKEHDYLNVDLSAKLQGGMNIMVNSVDYAYVTEQKTLTAPPKMVYSDTLEKGQTISKPGSDGLEVLTYQQKRVNGEVVETKLIKKETVRQPVAPQKIVGTKPKTVKTSKPAAAAVMNSAGIKTVSTLVPPAPIPLDANGRPVSYKKLITGKASAYSPNDGNTTATGKKVQPGYVAVNPKVIPYGTKMYIKTPDGKYIYGYASAEDTGGFARWGTRVVDLFFPTYSEAAAFGVRNVEIYILN